MAGPLHPALTDAARIAVIAGLALVLAAVPAFAQITEPSSSPTPARGAPCART